MEVADDPDGVVGERRNVPLGSNTAKPWFTSAAVRWNSTWRPTCIVVVENLNPYCTAATRTIWRPDLAEALHGVCPIVAATEPSRITMTITSQTTSRPIQASIFTGLARWAGLVERKTAPKNTRPAATSTM